MPLVKINLRTGRSKETKTAIADAIQASLVKVLEIPDADRYAMINEYDDQHFIHSGEYLDLKYTKDLLMIEITFIEGRPEEKKKELIKEINDRLVSTGYVREDDVFVMIFEVAKANVSFGKGLAQRAL
jgi:phenylpyruvate tautomerase PptA (4-oxalocrotonate tautomerase family)